MSYCEKCNHDVNFIHCEKCGHNVIDTDYENGCYKCDSILCSNCHDEDECNEIESIRADKEEINQLNSRLHGCNEEIAKREKEIFKLKKENLKLLKEIMELRKENDESTIKVRKK